MHSNLTPQLAEAVLADHLRTTQHHKPSSSPRRRAPAYPFETDTRPPACETCDDGHGGAAAAIGGIAWIIYALVAGTRPVGCVGPEACAVTPMRDTGDITILLLAGAVLISGALLAMARSSGFTGWAARLWRVGATVATAANAVVVVGMVGATSWEPAWTLIVGRD